MTQVQFKYLNERLYQARASKPSPYKDVALPEPAEVRKAQADVKRAKSVIERWQDKLKKAREARNDRVKAAHNEVKEAILFGDPDKALNLLKAFEKRVF